MRITQSAPHTSQTAIWQKKRFGDMRIIGQLHNTYIVCEADAGLILIDQHAAHERILFEALSSRAAGTKPSAQRLLVPETIELGFREGGVLEKLLTELADLGLEIEPFGGNTFVVKAVPTLLVNREVKPLVLEIVEKIVEGRVKKFYKEVCLLEQEFVKDPDKTIQQLVTEYIAKFGENITIKRFVRWTVGE